ncbi:MAG: cbb3-type cytochrome c oxidase subunit 3 [bacterium]|nr:cbb3-type cytochrome c oxidase subunit 3 [bacterium]
MELVDIHISMGTVRGAIAALTMATFLGIVWWAYRPGNRGRFEEDALLAFEDDERAVLRNRKESREGEER